MNPVPILLISTGLAIGAGVVTQLALSPSLRSEPQDAAVDRGGSERSRELREIEAAVAALGERIDQLAVRDASLPSARTAQIDLDAAIRDYLERHYPGLSTGSVASEAVAVEGPNAEELLAQLMMPGLDYEGREAVWKLARESGRLDELVEALEAYAVANPDDSDAQVTAGNAYLQQLRLVTDGPEKGMLASRADQAFDRALEIDPQHWSARYTKAIALSFWPPLFGKQPEAIRQFEVLVEQQSRMPAVDGQASTYELLGNLYQQTGELEKAREMWRTGLQRHPDSESLAAKLELDESH